MMRAVELRAQKSGVSGPRLSYPFECVNLSHPV